MNEKATFLSEHAQGSVIQILVQPRASKNELAGVHEGLLKIRLTAPPVEGEANKECIKFMAKLFDIAKSNFEIIQGHKSRRKTILIKGLSCETIKRTLVLKGTP
ncbi:MAG: DUF167 domain-containing protein [Desulforhabdus sp.]|jgi:uncharacterized protein (TIGR00251 family)|nr:DUF167 domain-containing protein [Desulforhabdus sp.]